MVLEILVVVYAAGIAIGLAVMRDPWPVRLGTAVAWPLGVVSFVVVTMILLASAAYLWPILALAFILVGAALWLAF